MWQRNESADRMAKMKQANTSKSKRHEAQAISEHGARLIRRAYLSCITDAVECWGFAGVIIKRKKTNYSDCKVSGCLLDSVKKNSSFM